MPESLPLSVRLPDALYNALDACTEKWDLLKVCFCIAAHSLSTALSLACRSRPRQLDTIGDAYMVRRPSFAAARGLATPLLFPFCGLPPRLSAPPTPWFPTPRSQVCGNIKEEGTSGTHCARMAQLALEIVAVARTVPVCPAMPELGTLSMRVGFHSGPVVASVIGRTTPKFTIFGDSVNTARCAGNALSVCPGFGLCSGVIGESGSRLSCFSIACSRMESHSAANRVTLDSTTRELLLQQAPILTPQLVSRGMVSVKGAALRSSALAPPGSQPCCGAGRPISAGRLAERERTQRRPQSVTRVRLGVSLLGRGALTSPASAGSGMRGLLRCPGCVVLYVIMEQGADKRRRSLPLRERRTRALLL